MNILCYSMYFVHTLDIYFFSNVMSASPYMQICDVQQLLIQNVLKINKAILNFDIQYNIMILYDAQQRKLTISYPNFDSNTIR